MVIRVIAAIRIASSVPTRVHQVDRVAVDVVVAVLGQGIDLDAQVLGGCAAAIRVGLQEGHLRRVVGDNVEARTHIERGLHRALHSLLVTLPDL